MSWLIGRLGASVGLVDDISQDLAVVQESEVLDVALLVTIHLGDGPVLLIGDVDLEQSEDLLELLGRYLEVVVSVMVLEEALGVEPLSDDQGLELVLQVLDVEFISFGWFRSTVVRLGSGIVEGDVHRLLEALLGEDEVHIVTEVPPSHLLVLVALEVIAELPELIAAENDLAHVQADSELSLSDESAPEFIKISEEFTDSNSLLFAGLSELGQDIFDVVWHVLDDIDSGDSGLGLGVVVERVVVSSSNSEQLLRGVNVVAEVEVIHFIGITFVHVGLEEGVEHILRGRHSKLSERSQELVLGDVLILCDIEVLEHWLQVNSLDLDSGPVLLHDVADDLLLLRSHVQVLPSGRHGVLDRDRCHLGKRGLLDTVGGEGAVDVVAEVGVIEEGIRAVHGAWVEFGLVLESQGIEFFSGQIEVEHGQDGLELLLGHSAFSKLIEIDEELFNSDSFHHDQGLEPFFNVGRIVVGVDSLLLESVSDDVKISSLALEESGAGVPQLAEEHGRLLLGVLGDVGREDVGSSVDVGAELEVVDLSDVALVEVPPQQKLVQVFRRREQVALLQHSSELLGGHVAALGAVVVLELGLDQDPLVLDFSAEGGEQGVEHGLFVAAVVGSGLRVFDDCSLVDVGRKHGVHVAAESSVVDEPRVEAVLLQELGDLAFVESEIQGAQAGAEL